MAKNTKGNETKLENASENKETFRKYYSVIRNRMGEIITHKKNTRFIFWKKQKHKQKQEEKKET